MQTKSRNLLVIAAAVLVVACIGCGLFAAVDAIRDSQASHAPAEPPDTPAPTALPVWVQTPGSVCIVVDQTFVTSGPRLPIGFTIEAVLDRAGMDSTTSAGATCASTLTVSLSMEGTNAVYSGETCYTGVSVQGNLTLSTAGRDPASVPVLGGLGHSNVTFDCPRTPAEAPHDRAWQRPVLAGLTALWGLPVAVAGVADEDLQVRNAATFAMESLDAGTAVPALIDLLSNPDTTVRGAAAAALGSAFAPQAAQAVPALAEAQAREAESWVRRTMVETIGKIGPVAVESVPALIEALSSQSINNEVMEAAIEALGLIGPGARQAIPHLIDLLQHPEWTVRLAASDALRLITGQDFGEDQEAWRSWWEAQS